MCGIGARLHCIPGWHVDPGHPLKLLTRHTTKLTHSHLQKFTLVSDDPFPNTQTLLFGNTSPSKRVRTSEQ